MSRPNTASSTSSPAEDIGSVPSHLDEEHFRNMAFLHSDSHYFQEPSLTYPSSVASSVNGSVTSKPSQITVLKIVKGLPKDLEARELRGIFTFCPSVMRVERFVSENGEIHGIVKFRSAQAATDAKIHLDGRKFDGTCEDSEEYRTEIMFLQSSTAPSAPPSMTSSSPGTKGLPSFSPSQGGSAVPILSPSQAPFAHPAVLYPSSGSTASSTTSKSRFVGSFNNTQESFWPVEDTSPSMKPQLTSSSLTPASVHLGASNNTTTNEFYSDVFSPTSPPRNNGISAVAQSQRLHKGSLLEDVFDDEDEAIINDAFAHISMGGNLNNSWMDGPTSVPVTRSQQTTSTLQGPQAQPIPPAAAGLRRNTTTGIAPGGAVNSIGRGLQNGLINSAPIANGILSGHPQSLHTLNNASPNPNPITHPHTYGSSHHVLHNGHANAMAFFPRMPPNSNPADQNPPCNTLYVGNLPMNTSEDELKALFQRQPGYKRLCFRTKANGPMCFVEFDDVSSATRALAEMHGHPISNSVKGGIRLSYSKNPLGVRNGQQPGPNGSLNGLSGPLGAPPGLGVPSSYGAPSSAPNGIANGNGVLNGVHGGGAVNASNVLNGGHVNGHIASTMYGR